MPGREVPWFEDAFRGDYLRVYAHRDDHEAAAEVATWLGRVPGLRGRARVLDLACGAGRHLRALRAAGVDATGADLSADLLREAVRLGARRLVRADNRALPFRDAAFDAVTCFFSSFGYHAAEAEDARVLAEAARVTRSGGGLLLDLMDPEGVRAALVPRSRREAAGVVVEEERRLTPDGSRVEKRVRIAGPEGERRWTESVRLYAPAEVERLAAPAGLEPVARYADHEGGAWRPGGTPRLVMVFRRA